jgi:hypothetical protein
LRALHGLRLDDSGTCVSRGHCVKLRACITPAADAVRRPKLYVRAVDVDFRVPPQEIRKRYRRARVNRGARIPRYDSVVRRAVAERSGCKTGGGTAARAIARGDAVRVSQNQIRAAGVELGVHGGQVREREVELALDGCAAVPRRDSVILCASGCDRPRREVGGRTGGRGAIGGEDRKDAIRQAQDYIRALRIDSRIERREHGVIDVELRLHGGTGVSRLDGVVLCAARCVYVRRDIGWHGRGGESIIPLGKDDAYGGAGGRGRGGELRVPQLELLGSQTGGVADFGESITSLHKGE